MTTEQIVAALNAAKEAAAKHSNSEDGGTCNLDRPVIFGLKAKVIEAAAEQAGLRGYMGKWLGRQAFHLYGLADGQGNRRTRMAEAACEALEAAGLDALVYYQID